MTQSARFLGLFAAVLATGCGSSSVNNNGPSTPTTGTATLTGAATGTLSVSVLGGFESPDTFVALVIDSKPLAYPNLSITVSIPGTSLQTGTFTSANVTEAVSLYTTTGSGGPTWEQAFDQNHDTGTFSLTLSSVGASTGAGTVTDWPSPHGSFSATLEAVLQGASGEVDVSVTF
jgi:hypothetical protein